MQFEGDSNFQHKFSAVQHQLLEYTRERETPVARRSILANGAIRTMQYSKRSEQSTNYHHLSGMVPTRLIFEDSTYFRCIRVAREYVGEGSAIDEQLRQVQCILQDVGSIIATPVSTARDAHLRKLSTKSPPCGVRRENAALLVLVSYCVNRKDRP